MQFPSLDDARRYLSNSIVKIPAGTTTEYGFVQDVSRYTVDGTECNAILFTPIGPNARERWINIDLITIPAQPIQLGNMNTETTVLWCDRMPIRRTQMGLTAESMTTTDITHDAARRRPDVYRLMRTEGMVDMLANNYPSIADAASSRTPKAFSRCFALNPIALTVRHLVWKGEIVGEFGIANGFTVYEPVAYITDILGRTLAAKGETYEISVAS